MTLYNVQNEITHSTWRTEKRAHIMGQMKQREVWVDNVKVIACILVLTGHCLMGLAEAGIMPEINIFLWFKQTIYMFHVPLFFVCSGYLYQKISNSKNRPEFILNKLIALGVPYFTFSFATWLLKYAFSGDINGESGNLLDILFVHPSSPYWYLYTLFFVFLITPKLRNPRMGIVMCAAALACKLIISNTGTGVYAIDQTLRNELWFIMGMTAAKADITDIIKRKPDSIIGGYIGVLLFTAASVLIYIYGVNYTILSTAMGVVACVSITLIIACIFRDNVQNTVMGFLAKYTMPIFLMHTVFAAPVRIALTKVGIDSVIVHIIAGIGISIAGPVIAAMIMEKSRILEIFIYPNKFIKVGKQRQGHSGIMTK